MQDKMQNIFAVKLKPLEWFEKNAYLDHDNDYHPTKELRDYYDKYHSLKKENGIQHYKTIYKKVINDRIIYFRKYNKEKLELYKWGIEEVLYPYVHPQYFI